MEILTAKDLSFTYAKSDVPALSGVSFSVSEGQFVTVCGPTGGGKSTLLRLIKKEMTPAGTTSGELLFRGVPVAELSLRQSAESIGFVVQRPEEQIVSDRVGGELLFGAQSLGYDRERAMRRAAEIADLFGFTGRFSDRTSELSGGRKQLLTLASTLLTSPSLLLLDEPTSRLDPVASADLISMLVRINRELGVTVIVAEHDTSRLLSVSDAVMFMEGGKITAFGPPEEVLSERPSDAVLSDMPTPVRLFFDTGVQGTCPLDVKAGRRVFSGYTESKPDGERKSGDPALQIEHVYYRYDRGGSDVLRDASLTVNRGEIRFIFGGNGCGKSTLLHCAAGLYKPYSGKVKLFGKKPSEYGDGELYGGCVSLLCQDVSGAFTYETVGDQFRGADLSGLPFDVTPLFGRHPYDLSGGELQIAALCLALLSHPRLLLLDEPTKGMDASLKKKFSEALSSLASAGVAIVIVSHDTELAAQCADTCSMMFDGGIVCTAPTGEFMRGNAFYTTDVCRMTGGGAI
ncbi:MAG: ATP-binding cassette domain-containing protein [Clostridia bacterium]|nr:ATP-binding cassette domain-containing protein [Clostridia bacterium]